MMVNRGEQAGLYRHISTNTCHRGDEKLVLQSTAALLSTAFNRFVSACRAELRG